MKRIFKRIDCEIEESPTYYIVTAFDEAGFRFVGIYHKSGYKHFEERKTFELTEY